MNDPVETMDKVMDRKKIVKVKQFKLDYNGKWQEYSNGATISGYGDFEQWQRSNSNIKVLNTAVTQKELPSTPPTPPSPPPKAYENYMFVTYEEYENIV